MRKRCPVLILAFRPDNPHMRGLSLGAGLAAQTHGWRALLVEPQPAAIANAAPDDEIVAGIIHGNDPAIRAAMEARTATVVALQRDPDLPRVLLDDAAIGETAAEHFIALGTTHGAFVGEQDGYSYAIRRQVAFSARLAMRGGIYLGEAPTAVAERAGWLARLPARTGLLCANDVIASACVAEIAQAGLLVGQDLLVLGTDDDEVMCAMTDPTLSSIAIDARAIGSAAVDLADRLRRGEAPQNRLVMGCLGVVPRRSTGDGQEVPTTLRTANAFITTRFATPLTVRTVALAAGLPVRTLEYQFRRHLGRSVAEAIRIARIDHACNLLATTRDNVDAIALACGYASASAFAASFRRLRGCAPLAFRQRRNAAGG